MTLSLVPVTATGIVCGKCSSFRNQVRHASVTAVRTCNMSGWNAPAVGNVENESDSTPSTFHVRRTELRPSVRSTVRPELPAGRYALRTADGTVKFYVVDRPTEGKWAGWTFVNVQASDELHPIRNRDERTRILSAILLDVRGASVLYGRELGVCGVCGRTLTDETSRANGIGPICASKF